MPSRRAGRGVTNRDTLGNSKMVDSPSKAPKRRFNTVSDLARHLTRRHTETQSWRQIADDDYDDRVKAGTLCRIANGGYDPRRSSIRVVLGLPRTIRLVAYTNHIRQNAILLLHSRKCARRRCRIHFVGAPGRLYCSDYCSHLAELARRKRQAQARRRAQLMRKRHGQRA